jgi:hypothetical protein
MPGVNACPNGETTAVVDLRADRSVTHGVMCNRGAVKLTLLSTEGETAWNPTSGAWAKEKDCAETVGVTGNSESKGGAQT